METESRRQIEERLPPGLPVETDTLFPEKTRGGEKLVRLLGRLAPVLRAALHPGERVQFATTGTVNLWWEAVAMGIWAPLINRTGIVLTTERMLLIHMKGKKPRHYVNQVRRSAIVKITGIFTMGIKTAEGTINVSGIAGGDRRRLKDLVGVNDEATGGMEHLCPICYGAHEEHTLQCDFCEAHFKSPRKAALLSLVGPGMGDFYLGHRLLACIEIAGIIGTWFITFLIVVLHALDPDLRLVTGVLIGLGLVAAAHVFDAVLVLAQGKKGLISLHEVLETREADA